MPNLEFYPVNIEKSYIRVWLLAWVCEGREEMCHRRLGKKVERWCAIVSYWT